MDLTSEECPIPFIKAMATLTKMKEGDTLEVITSDQKCYDMIVEGVKTLEQELTSAEKKGNVYHIVIKRRSTKKNSSSSNC
ncbi:hypothetical protein HS7_04750 [Sulfolobales archaeon HS-7]|nr:hypothetical protein HS7_04750 [Sulfolobales archaeon HS-7]